MIVGVVVIQLVVCLKSTALDLGEIFTIELELFSIYYVEKLVFRKKDVNEAQKDHTNAFISPSTPYLRIKD